MEKKEKDHCENRFDYKCVVDWGDDVVVSSDIYKDSYCLSLKFSIK